MGEKYLLLSLSTQFGKLMCERVANLLGLFFLNIDEYVEYSLFDSSKMLQTCGKDYVQKRELNAVKSCVEFENVVFSCSYTLFSNNLSAFNGVEKLYLAVKKEDLKKFNDEDTIINQIGFVDRNKTLRKICNIVEYDMEDFDEFAKKIIKKIGAGK